MRNPGRGLALLAVLLAAAPAAAQPRVEITDVRVGLPPGRFVTQRDDQGGPAHVVKAGVWAPVYVQLKLLKEENRPAALVVESTDADNLGVSFAVPLQSLDGMPPGSRIEPFELRYLPYVRPSGRHDVTVSVRVPGEGKPADWRLLSEPKRIPYLRARDPAEYVVLSLGTKLPGFDLPNEKAAEGDDPNLQAGLRNGRIETAAILNVNELPDRWYGYDAADLVVLATGAASDKDFLLPLFTEPAHRHRLDALIEWVRRGGRLVVSVGWNAQLLAQDQFKTLHELLPVALRRDQPADQVKEVMIDWAVGASNVRVGPLAARQGATFPAANTVPKPDRGFRQMVPAFDDAPGEGRGGRQRIVTQAAYGLGRVTLVAFDLDRSPFTEYAGRPRVWDLVLREAGSPRPPVGSSRKAGFSYSGVNLETEDELAAGLRTHLDAFEGVPVISFGWVALFIALYTLLIGPVEYVLLKKVFKRLELTWITFPLIVLSVSAAAYFTAYYLKGSDLMVNKVDVVDVDPASGRVYGRTWFSVFSPRIDTYRIGVDPNAGWAAANPDQPHPGAVVDWLGATRANARGGSFFRRSYSYKLAPPDGTAASRGAFSDGLVDVPIQVWSTKPFAAEWSAYLDRASAPVVSDLAHPPSDPKRVAGTFTLNLPLPELRDAYLIYAGKAYKQDNPVVPGRPVTVLLETDAPNWLAAVGNPSMLAGLATAEPDGRRRVGPSTTGSAQLFGVLFHDLYRPKDDDAPTNSMLRRLDQSWRVSELNRDEVILIGKLPPVRGSATDLIGEKDSPSPTRLWLKDLPEPGKAWPGVNGTMTQETYVRVYVPVKPAARR
jgi:hypothetical protein